MIPIEKNKEYTAEIMAVSSDGNGICRINGYTVFVPETVTGDKVKFLAVKLNSGYGTGKLLEITEPSEYRVSPMCDVYKSCGGCQLMHIDYGYQLRIKSDIIENAMRRIGNMPDFKLSEMVGAKEPYRYRNKIIFPVGTDKNGTAVCGFYEKHSHTVTAVEDCPAGKSFNAKVLGAVKAYMDENNVKPYDEKNRTGLIRRIFTRVSEKYGSIMVVISANGSRLPNENDLIERLKAVSCNITGIILNVNTKNTSLALGEKNITLWGKNKITDNLLGLDFEISPHSFYQINPQMTEKLYKKALEYADLSGEENVLDIYCGIGTISLCAAKRARHVIGVEIVEQAICDAKKNASLNKTDNAEFYAAAADKIVPELVRKNKKIDTVILDPPRKGADEKTLTSIAEAKPKKIVYVSCNPSTLARDVKLLCGKGYVLEKACGFDMFPNTVHVECVVLMTKVQK